MSQSWLISVLQIKKRGWTNALIRDFLKNERPELRLNPKNERFAQMILYKLKVIKEIEQTEEFQRAFAKSRKRSVISKAAHARKRERASELVPLKPDIYTPDYLREKLIQKSGESFDEFEIDRKYFIESTSEADEYF